ncbi:MAG TPA: transposase, partial [Candidatus Saccharimonadales bacterium]|nr:transposase [Candidatus Saccharimonadales bacterium]
LTFTLPAELRLLARQNQMLIYNLLFRASAQATQQLARDPRFVGGQIGMVGVLQTWTRDLVYHPHIHYLAPGGGVGDDGRTWLPARKNFFLPVKALSKLFRAAFQRALRKTALYTRIPAKVWRRDWVVHCKPVGNGQAALKYLAPYIHRIALSNRRLLSIDHRGSLETSQVTFQYRPSDTGQLKTCTLSVEHFIQRFLQHVLPRGFVKVRYFGFLGASVRPRLRSLRQRLQPNPPTDNTASPPDSDPAPASTLATPPTLPCPNCGQPMRLQHSIAPIFCRSP